MEYQKTSIYLPTSVLRIWRSQRRIILAQLGEFLHRMRTQPPRRGGTAYNRGHVHFAKVSETWRLAWHRALKLASYDLRMSVSSLVYQLILFVLAGKRARHCEIAFRHRRKSQRKGVWQLIEEMTFAFARFLPKSPP